jgi:hypothetical protein
VVRDPWDWQVSIYHYGLQTAIHPERELYERLGSFDEYIRWRCDGNARFQSGYVSDAEGNRIVSYITKLETLSEGFAHICDTIGVQAPLRHTNPSQRRRNHLSYYTDTTHDLVRQTFARDIEAFGYDSN